MRTSILKVTTEFNDIPSFISDTTLSTNIWFSGCNLNCKGCHNEFLQIQHKGMFLDDIKNEMEKRSKTIEWLVLTGGDPLYNQYNIYYTKQLIEYGKSLGFNIFLYTGQEYNSISGLLKKNIMDNIDYIKVGCYNVKFDKSKYDKDYFFATINQKIVNGQGKVIYSY